MFLEAAAPGYLTDHQWDALGHDWLEQALGYEAVPLRRPGLPGSAPAQPGPPVQLGRAAGRVPARGLLGPARPGAPGQPVPPGDVLGRRRRLRHARRSGRARRCGARSWPVPGRRPAAQERRRIRPPPRRPLPRYSPGCLRTVAAPRTWPPPRRPRRPGGVADLLDALRARARGSRPPRCWPATRPPTPPSMTRTAWLPAGQPAAGGRARAGRRAGRRAAAHAASTTGAPWAACWTPCGGRAAAGPGRRAGRARRRPRPPRQPARSGQPAGQPAGGGAHDQAAALGPRPAAHAALDDPGAVGWLLGSLRAAGAGEQAAALAGRAAAPPPTPPSTTRHRGPPAGHPAGGGRARPGRRADRSAASGRPVRALPQAARPRGSVPFRAAG